LVRISFTDHEEIHPDEYSIPFPWKLFDDSVI
jgi:hypothetical protein